jgi:hypothetical protein
MNFTYGVGKLLSQHLCDGVGRGVVFVFYCHKVVLLTTLNQTRQDIQNDVP